MESAPNVTTKRVTWKEQDNISLEARIPITRGLASVSDEKVIEGWRTLFAFTRRQHIVPLSLALFTSITAGATGPALTIFVGKLFDTFAQYASGALDHDTFEKKMSQQAVYLAVLGILSFLLGGGSYVGWITFGETQARACRSAIFNGLLRKPISWYDTRRSGPKALVARLNT
jgi:ATP-binding cassette subfamily B (MDR/TAP) protein 1